MVTRQVLESDLSGQPDASTVRFGLRGQWHEIELTEAEQAELEEMLLPYITAGRRKRLQTSRDIPATTRRERAKIRHWAKWNGYEVADHGVIPNHIFAAYDEALRKRR